MIGYGKWRLIFLIIIFSILLINAVSATDDVNLDENSLSDYDENSIELSENGNDIEIEAIHINPNLKSDDDNFDTIQKLIDEANDGDSIYLGNKNYKGNGTPIKVNKSINIYGYQYQKNQGSVLDADSKSNIFIVDKNIHLNLYGLKLMNGNGYRGGTIYNEGSLKIFNLTFENSKGEYGGAIYNSKDLEIYGSSFNRNTAFDGGAIYNNANLLVKNSNFTRQRVTHKAGVIYTNGILNIEDSIFNLTSGADEGVAIFTYGGTATIKSSKFLSNKALSYGGGIDNSGLMTIENCEFDRNSAYGAGAIDNGGEMTIINSIFTNNKATVNGGAIDSNHNMIVIGSVFENNSASGNGGAIIARSNTSLSYCSILNNADSKGYVIYTETENISLNNNWWGLNNPKFEEILNIDIGDSFRWIIMNFTNASPLNQNSNSKLIINFNHATDKNNNYFALNDSSKLANLKGNIVLEGKNGKTVLNINIKNGILSKSISIGLDKIVSATIHNQTISLDILENANGNIDEDDIAEENDTNSNNKSEDSNDFNETEVFNLNKLKTKDFIRSIHSEFINPNSDKGSDNEINDKNNGETIDRLNELTYIILISVLAFALLIIIAFKRKKDEDDEN